MYNYRRDFAHDNCPSPLSLEWKRGEKIEGLERLRKIAGGREIVEYTEIRRIEGR